MAGKATSKPQQAQESQQAHELRQACSRMAQAIEEHGVNLDIGLINTSAQGAAACRMLVEAGICTAEQMDAAILEEVKRQLAQILIAVEQAKLAAQKQAQGLSVVKGPGLVVAKH